MLGRFVGVARTGLSLAALAGVLACAPEVQSARPAPMPPQLALSNDRVDFGRLDPYEKHERTVQLRNVGGSTLHLGAVNSSCRCTRVALDKYAIPAGGEIPLTIRLELADYDSDNVHTRVHVTPADPRVLEASLEVSAEIAPEFVLEPDALDWGPTRQASAVTKHITVRRTGTPPVRLERVDVPPPWLATTGEANPEGYRIDVTLPAGAPRGVVTGRMAIVTDVKRRPRREVPLRGEVVGLEVVTSPRVLVFGPVAPGAEAGTVELTSPEPFQVIEVRCPPASFDWHAEEPDEGRKTRLHLSVAKDAPPGDTAGKLQVILRAGGQEESAELPFFGSVAARE